MRLNITLAWRPLYDLISLIYFRKARTTPTPLYRNLGLTLVLLARKARRHVSMLHCTAPTVLIDRRRRCGRYLLCRSRLNASEILMDDSFLFQE
jgi:hypothetical protein